MKQVIWTSLVCIFVLFVLSTISVYSDDSADLAKLQPLSTEEKDLYKTVRNDHVALHKFIVSRTYFRRIDQLCPTSVKECYKIAPPLPVDLDSKYAVTFDEQVLYLQILAAEGVKK